MKKLSENKKCKNCGEWRQTVFTHHKDIVRKCDCGYYRFDDLFRTWIFMRGPEVEVG